MDTPNDEIAPPQVTTPEDILRLLPRAGVLSIILPDRADSSPFVQGFIAAVFPINQPSKKQPLPASPVVFPGAHPTAAAFKQSLHALPSGNTYLLDATGTLPSWASQLARTSRLLSDTIAQLHKSHSATIVILPHRLTSAGALSTIVVNSSMLLEVFGVGPWLYLQFTKAPPDSDPLLRLPRVVKLSEKGFRLTAPQLPAPGKESPGSDALLELYRRSFVDAGEGMVLFDPRGTYREANRRALELFGTSAEELQAAGLHEIVDSADYFRALRLLALLSGKRKVSDHLALRRKSGTSVDADVIVTLIQSRLAVATIHEGGASRRAEREGRAQVEESVKRFQGSPVPQAVFTGRKLAEANHAFRELFAATLSENATPTLLQLFGRDLSAVARSLGQVGEATGPAERMVPGVSLPSFDGSPRIVDLAASRLRIGDRNSVLVSVLDATEREKRIRELERRSSALRSVADTDVAPMVVVRQGQIVWANRGCSSLFGAATVEDIVGKSIVELLVPRDRRSIPARLAAESLEGGDSDSFEFSIAVSEGKPLRLEAVVQRVLFEEESAGVAILRNVTGKLTSTQELREKLDEHGRVGKILGAGRSELEPSSCIRALFSASLKYLGFDAGIGYRIEPRDDSVQVVGSEEIPETAFTTLASQSVQEGITGYVARTQAPLHLQLENYPPHLPYKILFESAGFRTILYLPLASHGVLHGILVLCSKKSIDPSDLNASFLEHLSHEAGEVVAYAVRYTTLHETERTERLLLESLPGIAYELSGDGSFVMLAGGVKELLGHDREEFLTNPDLWRQCVHSDDRATYAERLGKQSSGESGGEVQYRMLPRGKAEPRIVDDRFRYFFDDQGRLTAIRGVVTDVTGERERSGKTAKKSVPSDEGAAVKMTGTADAIMATVIDKMGDAFSITDLQGKIAEVNTEFTRLTGYTRHEAIGMQLPYPWLLDEEYGTIMRWITALREKKALRDFDMNWVARDGRRLAISLNTSLLRNASGEPYAMLNIARNITERKTLSDTLALTNRRVEMLNRIVSAANASLDIPAIFKVVADEIMAIVPCDVVVLDMLSKDGRTLEVVASYGQGDTRGPVPASTASVEGTPAQRVIETQESVLYNNVAESGDTLPEYFSGFASFLSIPLRLNERVIGTLDLAGISPATFAPDDIGVLHPIADQLGPALQNALLYSEIQAQVQRVRALSKVGESLAGALDTEHVIRVVAEEVLHSMIYDRFVYASAGKDGSLRTTRVFATTGAGLQGAEIRDQDRIVIGKGEGLHAEVGDLRYFLAANVRGKDFMHGLFCVCRTTDSPLEESDLRLAQSIATLAGIALDRVVLYEDTLVKAAEIEARNRDLDDFTYVVSHDLKEPLITIEGYSSVVQQEFGAQLTAEAGDYLRSIVQATERLKRLIDDLLTLSRVGRARFETAVVDTKEVVGTVLRDLEYTIRERGASVEIPDALPHVHYNVTQLGLVFRNLISNGIKFNKSERPTVSVSVEGSQRYYTFCISDNGIGIPQEYFEKIFVIFQRLHPVELFPGTGAGLTIVKKIVERHGGKIWVESTVGSGARFYFSIPRQSTASEN